MTTHDAGISPNPNGMVHAPYRPAFVRVFSACVDDTPRTFGTGRRVVALANGGPVKVVVTVEVGKSGTSAGFVPTGT